MITPRARSQTSDGELELPVDGVDGREQEKRMTDFVGGSPVTKPGNPYNDAESLAKDATDILPSLDVEGLERAQLAQLDAYGSAPVTSDSAAERPLNPPTTLS